MFKCYHETEEDVNPDPLPDGCNPTISREEADELHTAIKTNHARSEHHKAVSRRALYTLSESGGYHYFVTKDQQPCQSIEEYAFTHIGIDVRYCRYQLEATRIERIVEKFTDEDGERLVTIAPLFETHLRCLKERVKESHYRAVLCEAYKDKYRKKDKPPTRKAILDAAKRLGADKPLMASKKRRTTERTEQISVKWHVSGKEHSLRVVIAQAGQTYPAQIDLDELLQDIPIPMLETALQQRYEAMGSNRETSTTHRDFAQKFKPAPAVEPKIKERTPLRQSTFVAIGEPGQQWCLPTGKVVGIVERGKNEVRVTGLRNGNETVSLDLSHMAGAILFTESGAVA